MSLRISAASLWNLFRTCSTSRRDHSSIVSSQAPPRGNLKSQPTSLYQATALTSSAIRLTRPRPHQTSPTRCNYPTHSTCSPRLSKPNIRPFPPTPSLLSGATPPSLPSCSSKPTPAQHSAPLPLLRPQTPTSSSTWLKPQPPP